MSTFRFKENSNLSKNKMRRKKNNPWSSSTSKGGMGLGSTTGSTYTFDSSTDASVSTNTNDGEGSLTYSASSSQAGESTDSSVAELYLLVENGRESQQNQHLQKVIHAQGLHDSQLSPVPNGNRVATALERQNISNVSMSSFEYSQTDDDSAMPENYARIISGQPSGSQDHDGGGMLFTPADQGGEEDGRVTPRAIHSSHHYYHSQSTPSNKSNGKRSLNHSPATVAASELSHGSCGTPHTPPPRHAKKISEDGTEVWYLKWWMCGFPDSLNFRMP